MKTILAAVDFSQITQKVVDGASLFAEAMQAKLVLLNVWEPIASYMPVGAAMDVITAPVPVEPPDLNLVKERLEQLAAPLRNKGLTVETLVSTALPVEEILNQSKLLGASIIILGSHGHGALFQLFSGSVVTSVLHKSTIPVTVIPVHGN
ncbi:MAG: universal stress protein [Verrucomicrobiota bacterium]|jgi:nucleotide-binding universal stress UspA family protein